MKNYQRLLLLILATNLCVNATFAQDSFFDKVKGFFGGINQTTSVKTGNTTNTTTVGDQTINQGSVKVEGTTNTFETKDILTIKQFIGTEDASKLFFPLTEASTKQVDSTRVIFKEFQTTIKEINKSNQELLIKQAEENRKFTEQIIKQVTASPPIIPITNASSSLNILQTNSNTTPAFYKQEIEQNTLLITTLNGINTTLQNLNLTNNSMQASQVLPQTTSFTAEWGKTYSVAATAALTITLPTAVGNNGKDITLIRTDSTAFVTTINPNAAETVNGQDSLSLNNGYSSNVIRSDGTNVIYVQGAVNVTTSYMYARAAGNQSGAGGTVVTGSHPVLTVIESSSGSGVTLDTTTAYTNTNNVASRGRFTLKGNSSYELLGGIGDVAFLSNTGFISYGWFNADTGVPLGTATGLTESSTGFANYQSGGGPVGVIFSPTVDTRVEMRIISQSNVSNWSGPFNSQFAWASIKVISGFLPVTGQSVDYVYARQTASGGAVAVGTYDTTTLSGNITNTAGVYALKAGKTYKLKARVVATASVAGYWSLASSATNLVTGYGAFLSQNPSAPTNGVSTSADTAEIIYTPTTDTNVRLYITSSSGNWSSNENSYIEITQIGTSAITSTTRSTMISRGKSAQSIPNSAFTTLTNWIEVVDTTASFNAVTGVYTAPRTANYQIVAAGYIPANAAGQRVAITLTKNGGRIATQELTTGANFFHGVSLSTIIELAAGDTVDARMLQTTGGALNDGGGVDVANFSVSEINPNF